MSLRIPLALVCILTLTGCETSTAPTPATPSAAVPTTPSTLPAVVVGNDAAPVATLLGQPVYARDCLSPTSGIGDLGVGIHLLVLGVLMNDFCDPQSLTLSQTEIDAFWQRMQTVAATVGKGPLTTPPFDEPSTQARLDDVRRKLTAPDLPWLERLTLQGQERGFVYALERKTRAAALAYETLLPMRCTAALYKKYGGKVVGMPLSMVPAEAYLKLVQEAEASGKLQFHHDALKQAFRERVNNDLQRNEIPPERVDFSLPVWLQMAGAGSATPPSVPAPLAVVPPEKNLITDPSLENTAPGERYPASWGTGNLIPPNAYQHQVVNGGRTGQRGWMIEGDGQYAVVPMNRPPVDRALRYAARGWVRLEAGSAQLKILYFDANGRYIGENRAALTNKRGEWHHLTTTDDLANWPEARSLSLALSLLGFDENFGGYRFWVFGSGAEAFERTGQWDAASQTLKLDVKPPTPGVTGLSTDRFVGDDQIESTLLVKNTDGQIARDMRAIWVRKAATVSDDIDFSSGPVADSEELTLLQKLAGDWTNHATSKP